jgi:hypothetical protein
MTQPAALVERRHICSGIAIRLGVGILVAWLGCAWSSRSAAHASPIPRAAPSTVAGHVLRPSAAGLKPAAYVEVQRGVCFALISTCLTQPDFLEDQGQTTTEIDGSFHLSPVQSLYSSGVSVLRTQIDFIDMRAVVDCTPSDIVISPISEATARLLAAGMARSYGACGLDTIAEKVANANRDTDFAGLSVGAAIDAAMAAALQDPIVLQALLTPTPTPTRTPTPTSTASPTTTPTATHTFHATATPQPCAGDCDGDHNVTVDELVRGLNIALGDASLDVCPAMDRNHDGSVSVNELVVAVNSALSGCMLPDLSIVEVQAVHPPGCGPTDDVLVEVCVANFGDRDVGAFQVSLDQGREVFEVSSLQAGDEQCSLHQRAQNEITVVVDPANLIVESDEQNNSADVTLTEAPPRVTCTPTRTPTPTWTPEPTGTSGPVRSLSIRAATWSSPKHYGCARQPALSGGQAVAEGQRRAFTSPQRVFPAWLPRWSDSGTRRGERGGAGRARQLARGFGKAAESC